MVIQLARVALLLLTMWLMGEAAERIGKRVQWARLATALGTAGLGCKLGAVMLTAYVVIALTFRALGILPGARP